MSISDDAKSLAANLSPVLPGHMHYPEVLLAATLAVIDKEQERREAWEKRVEERLRRNEPNGVCGVLSPRPLTGVALTCMLPPGHSGPHSDSSTPLPMLWGGAAEFATLPKKAFEIRDLGPSKYDADPTEPEQ